jgi:arylsulfatase A-like enzyme
VDRYFNRVLAPYSDQYPDKPPSIGASDNYYVLEKPFNWMVETLPISPQLYPHYYHFYPPHAPYQPRIDFTGLFNDGWETDEKPFEFAGPEPQRKANRSRREYDRFVADFDNAFADLYRGLEQSGVLQNSWLVLTSDHGEMFERGFIGHINITLFDPLVRVPLLIFPPGTTERIDIEDRTSALDVLPTLLQVTGQQIPADLPGSVLPPFDLDYQGMPRKIFTMNPKHSSSAYQLREGIIGLLQDEFKLVYYFGHEEMGDVPERVALYDLMNDPEELTDLYADRLDIAAPMLAYLMEQLEQANSQYPPFEQELSSANFSS